MSWGFIQKVQNQNETVHQVKFVPKCQYSYYKVMPNRINVEIIIFITSLLNKIPYFYIR